MKENHIREFIGCRQRIFTPFRSNTIHKYMDNIIIHRHLRELCKCIHSHTKIVCNLTEFNF